MPTIGFPQFRNLPTELRLTIWSFCTPCRRVYEMDEPISENHAVFPPISDRPRNIWASPAGLVPVVAHVCREAREVALKSRPYVTVTGEGAETDQDGVPYPPWTPWNANLPVRLRKGFDIVHLHWHKDYDRHVWLPPAPNPWPSFQWLANQAAAASVSAELLHPFDQGQGDPVSNTSTIRHEEVKYFRPGALYYVVLAIVEIHMSNSEAAHAGVFGLFGEEPIQLVDPRDAAAVAKFRDVWQRRQPPEEEEEEPDVAEFFARTTGPSAEGYHASVEQWRQELDKIWLWHKCVELGVSDETGAAIWPDPARPVGTPLAFFFPPSRTVDWSHRALDRDHAWVRTQLGLMPRFEPALMFRHCNHVDGCRVPRRASPLRNGA